MEVFIAIAPDLKGLKSDLQYRIAQGWRIQGSLCYGGSPATWAVLLVKEKEVKGLQYPYEPERKMAYQEVAQR